MDQRLEDRVVRLALFVLDTLHTIEHSAGAQPEPEDIRPQLLHLLRQVPQAAADPDEGRLVQTALVMWADDVLAQGEWWFAPRWAALPVERELFGTTDRSWQFFEQAEAARRLGHLDALETFALCVRLGFRGVYRDGVPRPARVSVGATSGAAADTAACDVNRPHYPARSAIAASPHGTSAATIAIPSVVSSAASNSPQPAALTWPPRRTAAEVLADLPETLDRWARSTFTGLPMWDQPPAAIDPSHWRPFARHAALWAWITVAALGAATAMAVLLTGQ
jgi:hypothetical protein